MSKKNNKKPKVETQVNNTNEEVQKFIVSKDLKFFEVN